MIKWKGKRNIGDNLRRNMPEMVRDYFAAGNHALQAGRSWDEMHRFRLLTKRFRYTLEIFRPAYGRGMERRIEVLKELQKMLGEINDAVVTSAMLEAVPGVETVREKLSSKAESKTAELRAFWAREFGPPLQCVRWTRYLTQYACRIPRPPVSEGKVPAEDAPPQP